MFITSIPARSSTRDDLFLFCISPGNRTAAAPGVFAATANVSMELAARKQQ